MKRLPGFAEPPLVTPAVTLRDAQTRDQDDMCIWRHPGDPALSTIVTSDKTAAKPFVYDLEGAASTGGTGALNADLGPAFPNGILTLHNGKRAPHPVLASDLGAIKAIAESAASGQGNEQGRRLAPEGAMTFCQARRILATMGRNSGHNHEQECSCHTNAWTRQ